MLSAVERTAANRRLTLVVALNYGSRGEIAAAARRLAEEVQGGARDPASIDEAALDREMQTADLPPLDLLIRTSGEVRLSNFLLWQAAYADDVRRNAVADFDRRLPTAALGDCRTPRASVARTNCSSDALPQS